MVTAQFSIVEVYTVATLVVSTTFLFIHNQKHDLINYPRYVLRIPMTLFQVEHPQISLLMGGNFIILHLNNAEILLKASKYGGKLKNGLNKNNKKEEYAKQKYW